MIGANVGTPDNDETRSQPHPGPARPGGGPSPASTGKSDASDGPSGKARRRRGRPRTGNGRRLFAFDRDIGCRLVAGADEAGRGSLAGPLVAAAVLFDLEQLTLSDRRALTRLNDSKQHTAEAREELYPLVMRAAASSVIVSRCVHGIDSRGLHKTNLEALRTALLGVALPGTVCLVDGFNVPEFGFEQRAVIDGDCRSAAIAAASVLAKVSRDRYMRRAAERHPGWDFETNVGYSTPEHRAAIRANGVSPLHRMSFQSIAYTQLALEG
jgi:ribonuclease HII